MSLLDIFDNKNYKIRVKCQNCNLIQVIKIPKGMNIESWLLNEGAMCGRCSCANLRRLKTVEVTQLKVEQEKKQQVHEKKVKQRKKQGGFGI